MESWKCHQSVIRHRLEMKMSTTTTEQFEIIKGTTHPSNTVCSPVSFEVNRRDFHNTIGQQYRNQVSWNCWLVLR